MGLHGTEFVPRVTGLETCNIRMAPRKRGWNSQMEVQMPHIVDQRVSVVKES